MTTENRIVKYKLIKKILLNDNICQKFHDFIVDPEKEKNIIGKGREGTIYKVSFNKVTDKKHLVDCAFKFLEYTTDPNYKWKKGGIWNNKWTEQYEEFIDFFSRSALNGFPHFPLIYQTKMCMEPNMHTGSALKGKLYILYELFDGDMSEIILKNNSLDTWISIFFQFYMINYYLEVKSKMLYVDGYSTNHLYSKKEQYMYKYIIKTKDQTYHFFIKHPFLIALWDVRMYVGIHFEQNFMLALLEISRFNNKFPNKKIVIPEIIIVVSNEISRDPISTPAIISDFFPQLTEDKPFDLEVEIDLTAKINPTDNMDQTHKLPKTNKYNYLSKIVTVDDVV
jgi:hypothetical protein